MPDSLDFDWAMRVTLLPDGRFDPPPYEAWGECLIDWWDHLGRLEESVPLFEVKSIAPDSTSKMWPYVGREADDPCRVPAMREVPSPAMDRDQGQAVELDDMVGIEPVGICRRDISLCRVPIRNPPGISREEMRKR